MKPEQNFKEEYAKTALELLHFVSWEGYGEHKGFHQFHETTPHMTLDRLLGMPWRINLPDNPLYVSFSGVARDKRNRTGEIRFSSPNFPGEREKKDFDNFARDRAPGRFAFIRMYLYDLRDANDPSSRLLLPVDPDWQPAISITDMPSEEEIQKRCAEAKEKHKANLAAGAERDKFYADMLASHDQTAISGRQALYMDIQKLLQREMARETDACTLAYYGWFDRYLDEKRKGKADKDILPLKLDIALPELAPEQNSAPAPRM